MQIRTTIQPGDLGRVVELHGLLYAQEYGLDQTFEGYVAAGLGEFAKSFDAGKDRLWLAEAGEQLLGSVAIVGLPEQTAQLRWFLVAPIARGRGLGRKLLAEAIAFCRTQGFASVFLWTIGELQAAAYLYEKAGFRRMEQRPGVIWGGAHIEERYHLDLLTE